MRKEINPANKPVENRNFECMHYNLRNIILGKNIYSNNTSLNLTFILRDFSVKAQKNDFLENLENNDLQTVLEGCIKNDRNDAN